MVYSLLLAPAMRFGDLSGGGSLLPHLGALHALGGSFILSLLVALVGLINVLHRFSLSDESNADYALLVDPWLGRIVFNTVALGVGALTREAERMRRHAARAVHVGATRVFNKALIAVVAPLQGCIIGVFFLVISTTAFVHWDLAVQTDVFITVLASHEGLSLNYEETLAFRSRTFLVALDVGQSAVFSLLSQLFVLLAHGLVRAELDGAGV